MIQMMLHRTWVASAIFCAAIGCGGKDSPPSSPSSGGSNAEVQISGSERLGWTQEPGSSSELLTFQYAIYVDGNRSVLRNVSCSTTPSASGFDCSTPLPALSVGSHTIELAAFIESNGQILESSRSSPLRLVRRSLALSNGM